MCIFVFIMSKNVHFTGASTIYFNSTSVDPKFLSYNTFVITVTFFFPRLHLIEILLQDLTEAMPRISNSIKSGDFNEFDDGVKDASGAVCALTESAAQVCL